jgi:small subunit ribosomal protein S19e
MGIYDVPASMLLAEIAKDLKTKIKQPEFTKYIKTGAHKERAPYNPDWFYTRMASMLYRVYKEGQIGTGALRTYYGGRRNKGVKPEKKVKAGGKAIRLGLQLLEKEGLIKKGKKGRTITTKGEKYLFQKAKEVSNIFNEQIKKQEEAKIEETKRREELKTKRQQTTMQNKTTKEEKNDERRRPEAKKA